MIVASPTFAHSLKYKGLGSRYVYTLIMTSSNTLAPFHFTSRSRSHIHIHMNTRQIRARVTNKIWIPTLTGTPQLLGKIPAVEDGGWRKDSSFVQTSTGWMERTRRQNRNDTRKDSSPTTATATLSFHSKRIKWPNESALTYAAASVFFFPIFPVFVRLFEVGFSRFCVFPKLM